MSALNGEIHQGIIVSVGFHLLVAAFFTLKMVFFPAEPIVLKGAVRVDLVALPDILPKQVPKHQSKKAKTIKKLSTPQKKKAKVIVEPEKPKVVLKPETASKKSNTANRAEDAIRRLKAKNALARLKKSRAAEKQPGPSKQIKYAGNIISPGTQLTGLHAVQMDRFISELDAHVKKNWILPQWMSQRTDLKSRVVIKINESGNLQSVQIVSSSGNTRYDDIVLQTIKKSDPFPKPPIKFRDVVSIKGIELGFPE